MTKIRVISDTTTFYPVEIQSDESHHRNDNMTLLTTITYLKEQLKEDFQFFKAGDLFIVLQQWRGMLFFIETNEDFGAEMLRFILQTAREILIFLFGTRFESVMRRNISLSKRQVFARYVDTYLKLCQNDHHFLLSTLRFTDDTHELQHFFLEKVPPVPKDIPIKLIAVFLFQGNEIALHFKNPKASKLEPEIISLIQIFVNVEFPDLNSDNNFDSNTFDPEYVKSGASAKHKSAFLRLERTPVGCTISCSKCAEKSGNIIVVVSENTKMPVQVQQQLNGYMSNLCQFLLNNPMNERFEPSTMINEDLIHFMCINRTAGDVWEMPEEQTLKSIENYNKVDAKTAREKYHMLTRKMASYAFNAIMHGYTTMMWGSLDYQFCYQLRFLNDNKEVLTPSHIFTPPSFDDDNGVTYGLIANSVFPSQNGVRCIEILSIYRSSIRPKEAMEVNQHLFQDFMRKIL